jgi:hypothetical protein
LRRQLKNVYDGIQGGNILLGKGFFTAVLWGALALLPLCGQSFAAAQESIQSKNVKTLTYEWDRTTPAYKLAWAAMADIYTGTRYDQTQTLFDEPVLFYAQYDLNGDGVKEVIAHPTEEMHEEGLFCEAYTTKCPHYILQEKDGVPVLLGKIYANAVDVTDESQNGYKKLKVFTMEDEAGFNPKYSSLFDVFVYDTDKASYINILTPPKPDDAADKEKK